MSEEKRGFPDNSPPPPYNELQEQQGYKGPTPPHGSQQPFLPPQQGYVPQQGYPPQQGYVYPPQGQGYAAPPPGQGYIVQGQPQMGQVMVQYPVATGMMNRPAPPDYMVTAICVTLFCFFPTGVFAIMKASDARSALAHGDFAEAESKSRSAKKLINISIAVGILSFVFAVVLIGIYVGVILNTVNREYDFD